MQTVLKNTQDDRLRAYFVWLPAIRSDDRASAADRCNEFSDPRVRYFWDSKQVTGLSWNKILSAGPEIWHLAWDVYLLYGPSTEWLNQLPKPDFWMHQLTGVQNAPRLDRSVFESKVKEFLSRANK